MITSDLSSVNVEIFLTSFQTMEKKVYNPIYMEIVLYKQFLKLFECIHIWDKKIVFVFFVQDSVFEFEISVGDIPGIYKGCFKKIF